MKTMCWCAIFVFVLCAFSQNAAVGYHFPRGAVMLGGYYGIPDTVVSRREANQQNNVPDTYYKTQMFPWDEETYAEKTTQKINLEQDIVDQSEDSVKRVVKNKPQVPTQEEEDQNDNASGWPFAGTKESIPFLGNFFPITIGGSPGVKRKSGEEDTYEQRGPTAIANSFSTGKGGVATSHATSFGDVYLSSSSLRNGKFNPKKMH